MRIEMKDSTLMKKGISTMNKHWASRLAIAIIAILALSGSAAYADTLPLRVLLQTGGSTGVIITDGGTGDINPVTGAVTFSGSLGSGFLVNVTTGTSKPIIGGNTNYAELDLNSVNVEVSGPGQLLIVLQDKNYNLGPNGSLSLDAAVGGTLSGAAGSSVSFQTWVNPNDLVPNIGPDVYPAGALSGFTVPAGSEQAWAGSGVTFTTNGGLVPFSSSDSTGFTKTGDYSIFSTALINFTGAGSVSFNLTSQVTPEPTSLLLLGSGLAALGWFGRRKRSVPSEANVS